MGFVGFVSRFRPRILLTLIVTMSVVCAGADDHPGPGEGPRIDMAGGTESGSASALDLPWMETMRIGQTVYFVYSQPSEIQRYDLGSGIWLDPIVLDQEPTAFTADGTSLYIAFGIHTSRFDLEGENEFRFPDATHWVRDIVICRNYLLTYDTEEMRSIDVTTGEVVDSWYSRYWRELRAFALAPNRSWVFVYDIWNALRRFSIGSSGILHSSEYSPDGRDYPSGNRSWIFPDETRIVTDTGCVFNTYELTYAASFGGMVDDVAFFGDQPVVLRDGRLISYSNSFLRTGEYFPSDPFLEIEALDGEVIAFFQVGSNLEAEAVPLDSFAPSPSGRIVDPRGLEIEPAATAIDSRQTIYILDSNLHNVHRYSVPDHDFLESIPLFDATNEMAYSGQTDTLYFGYPSGETTRVQLEADGTPNEEEPFANLPAEVTRVATAGEFLVVLDPSAEWSHYTIAPDGTFISRAARDYEMDNFVWNQTSRRMYYLNKHVSPSALFWEEIFADGVFGEQRRSSHTSSQGLSYPIAVRADGDRLVLGSGRIFDATILEQINTLSNDISAAAWFDESLVTLRGIEGSSNTEIQAWGSHNYPIDASREIDGEPMVVFEMGSLAIIGTRVGGKPRFSTFAVDLTSDDLTVSATDGAGSVEAGNWLRYTIEAKNLTATVKNWVEVSVDPGPGLECISWTCQASPGSECARTEGTGGIHEVVALQGSGVVTYALSARVEQNTTGSVRLDAAATLPNEAPFRDTDLTQVLSIPPSQRLGLPPCGAIPVSRTE